MTIDPGAGISAVERAFLQVELMVNLLIHGEKDNKTRALLSIFRLNNEIGKLARLSSIAMEPLRALQFDVNRITVAVRSDNPEQMTEALDIVRNSVRQFKADVQPATQNF